MSDKQQSSPSDDKAVEPEAVTTETVMEEAVLAAAKEQEAKRTRKSATVPLAAVARASSSATLSELRDVLTRSLELLEEVHSSMEKANQIKDNKRKLRQSIDSIRKKTEECIPTQKRTREETTPAPQPTKRTRTSGRSSFPEPANGIIYSPLEAVQILKEANPTERTKTMEAWIQEKKVLVLQDASDVAKLFGKKKSELTGRWWTDFENTPKRNSRKKLKWDALPLPENGLIYSPHEACAILSNPVLDEKERGKAIDEWIKSQHILVKKRELMYSMLNSTRLHPRAWWRNAKDKPQFMERRNLIQVVQTQLTVQYPNNSWDRKDLKSVLKLFKEFGIQATGLIPSKVEISDPTVALFVQWLGPQQRLLTDATPTRLPPPANGTVYSPREVHNLLSSPALEVSRVKIIDAWIKEGKIPLKKREPVLTLLKKRADEVKPRWTQRCNVKEEEFLKTAREQLLGHKHWDKEDVRRILLEMMGFKGKGNLLVNDINSRALAKYVDLFKTTHPLNHLAYVNTISEGKESDHGSEQFDDAEEGNDETEYL